MMCVVSDLRNHKNNGQSENMNEPETPEPIKDASSPIHTLLVQSKSFLIVKAANKE